MSEDKAVLIKTAYSYYQKGDWDRAIEEYHKLADLDPKDLNVHNMLADIYAKKGDHPEALQQYDLVAQGFDQKNQVDKVLQVYKRMLKLVPNDPQLSQAVKNLVEKYLDRAAQLEEGEPERASDIYRSILKAEPTRVDASLLYAKLLVKRGQKFEAVESLMNLASNLDPETQAERMMEILVAATELDPLNIEAREKLVELHTAAKQTASVIKILQELVEIHISRNDFVQAEATALKAIERGDQNAYYQLGVAYFNQQKYPESRTAFEKFLGQQGGHVGALKYLALACLRMNQNQDAVLVYLRILDVYFNENLLDEAREVRQTILELDPSNEKVRQYALDQHLVAPPAVLEEIPAGPSEEEVARMEEELQQAALLQAQAYTEKGLYEQAIDLYLDMLKRWPDFLDPRVRLQQVYALMARSLEPAEKYPSPGEMKSELERELREQMRKELEEQARTAQERQLALERQRELDQIKLKQELESKFMEQVQKSKEEDLRQQLVREMGEKQRMLEVERSRLEKERNESVHRFQAELDETKASLEVKIRAQIEKEMKEKLEKEQLLQSALRQEEDQRRKEEDQRRQYDSQKKEQEANKAKINQEILSGMERLRSEREKESKLPPVVSLHPPSEKNMVLDTPAAAASQESLDDPFVRQTLADIYAKQGMYLEALKIYERILKEEPNNEDVKDKLRNILRMKGI